VGAVRIRPEAEIRAAVQAAFVEHRRRVLELLPQAEVEHVGSTAIRGALTKGDLDLLVRVKPGDFDAAVAGLRSLYVVEQWENWTATFASFAYPQAADPPVGVQLAVAGSADEALFGPFRDALVADPALLAEYNALKLQHDGEDYERYTDVKAEFIKRVLASLGPRSP
jgi:GrpB-like predicted nucleotidyltransferase (UPF0157 family)